MTCSATGNGQKIVVRLFRLWSIVREVGLEADDRLLSEGEGFGLRPPDIAACVAFFAILEAELGRKLERDCLCSHRLSSDEAALLGVLHGARLAGPVRTTRAIPHGMPACLRWAAIEVCEALMINIPENDDEQLICPFGQPERELFIN